MPGAFYDTWASSFREIKAFRSIRHCDCVEDESASKAPKFPPRDLSATESSITIIPARFLRHARIVGAPRAATHSIMRGDRSPAERIEFVAEARANRVFGLM